MRTLPLALAMLTLAGVAHADGPALTYEQFEASVPHFDLATCPEAMKADSTFCRATFHNDAVHVYAFAEAGDQRMVGFRTFEEDAYALSLK